MVYTKEQIEEVKKQIFEQTKNLGEEQRKAIEEQVNGMNAEQLELFVKEQMTQGRQGGSQKGIFRMIVDNEMKSYKVDENKEGLAVLDIRPISKGHVIIIPKSVVGNSKLVPNGIFILARKIAKRISDKLGAKSGEIQTENKFGEVIINVIPMYDKPVSVGSQRYEASEDELNEVGRLLKVVKKEKVIRIKREAKSQEVLKLKRRIP